VPMPLLGVGPEHEGLGGGIGMGIMAEEARGTVALDANEHNSGGHRWALDVPKLGHSPSSRAPGTPRPALEALWPSSTQQCPPAHPERGFTGREQVRKNWTQIFGCHP